MEELKDKMVNDFFAEMVFFCSIKLTNLFSDSIILITNVGTFRCQVEESIKATNAIHDQLCILSVFLLY